MCPDLQQRLEDIGDQRRIWGPEVGEEQRAHVTLQVAPQTMRSLDGRNLYNIQLFPSVRKESGPWSQGDPALSPEISLGPTFLLCKWG